MNPFSDNLPGRRKGLIAAVAYDRRGQSTLELALILPVLLFLLLGMVEAARAFDIVHELKSLSREGANLASRGAEFDTVAHVLLINGYDLGLGGRGGAVISRVTVKDGTPTVDAQTFSQGLSHGSYLGVQGDTAHVLGANTLYEDQTVHVVELFYDVEPLTPMSKLFSPILPDTLYERAVF